MLPQSAPTPAPNQVYRLYYYAGAKRVAVRVWTGATGANDLYFLHSDHLGSTTVTTDLSQNIVGQQRYYAYGEPRNTSGTLHTDRRFTGQREETGLGSLYDYNARYYSPLIGRFISADSIVPEPGNPQALNRYAYVYNNPLRYTDPSGHCPICFIIGAGVALLVWLAYPEPVYAPEPGWTPPTDVNPNYGDKAYFDTAPGTGDISDMYAMATGRTLFTGEEVDAGNRALVGAAAVLPVVTSGALKQTRKLFDIVRYGDDASGFIKHHGVLDIWAAANIPGYVRRNPNVPTILLTKDQHDKTIGVFNKWRLDKTGSITGYIDWSKISPKEVQALAEQMLDAAGVPKEFREAYYREFYRYLYEEVP